MPRLERQRQKLREVRAAASDDSAVVECLLFLASLRKRFVDAGIAMLELHDDEAARTAIAEFIEHDVTEAEMLEIMEQAGEALALKTLEGICLADLKPQRRIRSYARDVGSSRGRRPLDG